MNLTATRTADRSETEAYTDPALDSLKQTLRRSYTKQSARYDARRSMSLNARFFFDAAYRTIDEMIGATGRDTVHLDVPVGTARFLFFLRDGGRRHRMFGFDLSPGMLTVSRQKAAQRGDTLPLAQADAFRLPVADNSVDLITCMRFFHLMPKEHWPAILAEMYRVLTPGGFMIAEFRNALRGGAVAWIADRRDRWLRKGPAHYYVWPNHPRTLFRGWDRIELRGSGLDGLAWLSVPAPRLARRLHQAVSLTPVRHLTRDLLVKAFKPVHP